MSPTVDSYPPAPANVPPDLTAPSTAYRLRVTFVLGSLIVFALFYLGLIVGSAYLCYWSFAELTAPDPRTSRGGRLLLSAAQTDERVRRNFADLLKRARAREITEARFVESLRRDILVPWQAQRRSLAQATDLPAGEQRLVRRFDEYYRLQEESWEAVAQAIQQNDARLMQQAQEKDRQADATAHLLSLDVRQYFERAAAREGRSGFWYVVLGIASGVLCLFLVKGFFKRQRRDDGVQVEVTEAEQPTLFAFIRQLCRDTGAPFPHRVYLTPDVNAAVFYRPSILNLFLPAPKNLVIGLGLVNRLNLSEFKAVLAHEFGHFSQRSMKLGSYVYMSNRIIGDLVFGRDWLDDLIAAAGRIDIRISIFVWAFAGLLWVVRKVLQGLFRVINFANVSLSRQMEFNADLVAVSVTGSDSLVHGLARLDLASDSLSQAWQDLSAAADHQLYSRDLFYHQARAAEYLRAVRKEPQLGEPPALPTDPQQTIQLFLPEDTSVPRMWATHPSNHDREANAKRHYIRSPIDDRSPWLLFADDAAVRERMTREIYRVSRQLENVPLSDPAVVQAFIDEEHAETTYDPRYHGLYDQRYLTPGDLDNLEAIHEVDDERLAALQRDLYGEELQARMTAHQARQREFGLLSRLVQGQVELTGREFAFRGERRRAADAAILLTQVRKELDDDYEWMGRFDRQVYQLHHQMARRSGDERRSELETRYRFQLALQAIHSQLCVHREQVQGMLNEIAGLRELTQEQFQWALHILGNAREALCQCLSQANRLAVPALKNVAAGEPLGPRLLSQPLLADVDRYQNSLNGSWIGRLLEQMSEVIERTQRFHFKSLGRILSLQEDMAARWAASRSTGEAPALETTAAISCPQAGEAPPCRPDQGRDP